MNFNVKKIRFDFQGLEGQGLIPMFKKIWCKFKYLKKKGVNWNPWKNNIRIPILREKISMFKRVRCKFQCLKG